MRNLLLSTLLALLGCTSAPKQNLQDEDLVCYEYAEHGTMAQPNHDIRVAISHDSTGCIVRLFDNPNYLYYKTDVQLLQQINQLIQSHQIYQYKEHYRCPFEVLDGTSWNFTARFKNGQNLSSHGHEAWPDDDGLQLINQKIQNHVKEQKPYKTVPFTFEPEEE